MFKNLILYRVAGLPAAPDHLESVISNEPFLECAPTQQKSYGWTPPRGKHGALVEFVGGQWIASFSIETRSVPPDALRKKVDEMVAEIEQTTGRQPGKKERRDLKEEALISLLPSAFPRRVDIPVWINPVAGIMAIDATQSRADDVVTSLVRASSNKGGECQLSISLINTIRSPFAAMTDWLLGRGMPDGFDIGRECELKGSGDEPARVVFDRHSLHEETVAQHIRQGKLPTRLALAWMGRLNFVLTSAMHLKKISIDVQVDEGDRDEDAFDADVAIATGELSKLIDELIEAMGGEQEAAKEEEIK